MTFLNFLIELFLILNQMLSIGWFDGHAIDSTIFVLIRALVDIGLAKESCKKIIICYP